MSTASDVFGHTWDAPDHGDSLRWGARDEAVEKWGLRDASQWLARKWEQLESRYGRRAALAMAVGMLATLPVPGNVAAIVGLAEGIRGLGSYFGKSAEDGRLRPNVPRADSPEYNDAATGAEADYFNDDAAEEKDWITIGGGHCAHGEHCGGTPVNVDSSGRIRQGPAALRGQDVDHIEPKEPSRGNRFGGKPGGRRGGHGRQTEGSGGRVAPEAGRPGREAADEEGSDEGKPSGEEATRHLSKEQREAHKKVIDRVKRYANVFRKKGMDAQAEWMDQLREHVDSLGIEGALAALGEERSGGTQRVQYGGAYDELGETEKDSEFIKSYLDRAGISLLQSGSSVDPNSPVVSGLPLEGGVEAGEGGYVPVPQTFQDKLEESKHLPGLESSEDIHKVVGSKVSQFTPEVIAKLDKKYGKDKWIVKSYGEEAYAGFGIFFPQRVKQIQEDAKAVLADAKAELKERGYYLVKWDDGTIAGVAESRKADAKVYHLGTPEFADLPKTVQRYGRQAIQASHAANGAVLPASPEDSLKNDYGISFRKDESGVPIGITNWDGKEYDFGDPRLKKIEETDGGACGYAIKRAKEADEWRRQGYNNEPKFMVQPAFEAVGVSDYDRAMGNTWETAKEGRVHCMTKDGKASVVPYATLVGRGDDLPSVFSSEDQKAMEKAVEDAINQLPESERKGQMYAPDVMKTKDGWRVIELNASAAVGGSDWLGRNPFVIDALVSHVTGREPQHAKFIRDLLKGKGVKLPDLPQSSAASGASRLSDEPGKRLKGRGQPCKQGEAASRTGCVPREGGQARKPTGQYTKPGQSKPEVYAVKHGNLTSKYSLHHNARIAGPSLPLKNYKQQDDHSCGFVAALTAARYLSPETSAQEVLAAVRPTKSAGIDRDGMVAALGKVGIRAEYKDDLTVGKLKRLVEKGTLVLLTVYPDDWASDHWTAVQGFDGEKVYLTNYRSLPVKQFLDEWYDRGEGLVLSEEEPREASMNSKASPAYVSSPDGVTYYAGKYWAVNRIGRDGGPFDTRAEAEAWAKTDKAFKLGDPCPECGETTTRATDSSGAEVALCPACQWSERLPRGKAQPSDDIDSGKACRMLEDGTAHSRPLTEAQRGMLGAACGKKSGVSKRSEDDLLKIVREVTGGIPGYLQGNRVFLGRDLVPQIRAAARKLGLDIDISPAPMPGSDYVAVSIKSASKSVGDGGRDEKLRQEKRFELRFHKPEAGVRPGEVHKAAWRVHDNLTGRLLMKAFAEDDYPSALQYVEGLEGEGAPAVAALDPLEVWVVRCNGFGPYGRYATRKEAKAAADSLKERFPWAEPEVYRAGSGLTDADPDGYTVARAPKKL